MSHGFRTYPEVARDSAIYARAEGDLDKAIEYLEEQWVIEQSDLDHLQQRINHANQLWVEAVIALVSWVHPPDRINPECKE